MAGFAAIALGLSDAMEREHREHHEAELSKRKTLADLFLKAASDPNAKPWMQQDAMRRLGMLVSTPPNKKLPSEVENLKDFGARPQETPQAAPQAPQQAPLPPGMMGGGEAPEVLQGGANQLPPPSPIATPQRTMTFAPPTPPEYAGPAPTAEAPVFGMEGGRYSQEEISAMHLKALEAEAHIRATEPIEAKKAELEWFSALPAEKQQAWLKMLGRTGGVLAIAGTTPGSALIAQGITSDPVSGTTILPNKQYHIVRDRDTQQVAATYEATQPMKTPIRVWLPDPSSSTGFKMITKDPITGTVLTETPGAVLPAGMPRVTVRESVVQQPDGTFQVVPLTTVTKPTLGGTPPPTPPGGAKAPAGGPGRTVGGRPDPLAMPEIRAQSTATTNAFKLYQQTETLLNVMKSAVEKSNKANTGAADMILLANHMGLSVGQIKGMRTGTEIMAQHAAARNLSDRIKVWFAHYKAGDVLSPQQRADFLSLAQDRFDEAKREYEAHAARLEGLKKAVRGGTATPAPLGPRPPLGSFER